MPKTFTIREQQVIELLTQGKSNAEIASTLGISINTVKTHISRILLKLNAKSRLQVVANRRLSRLQRL